MWTDFNMWVGDDEQPPPRRKPKPKPSRDAGEDHLQGWCDPFTCPHCISKADIKADHEMGDR